MSTLLPGSAHRRQVLRAAALAGTGLGALATTGCGASATDPAGRTDVPAGAGAVGAVGAVGDTDLLRAALAATDRALADLRTAIRRHPALASRLDPAVRVHRGHREVLAEARPAPAPSSPATSAAAPGRLPATGGPDGAVDLLAAREEATAARLASSAVRADSGVFARLLGSASASVATVAAGLRGTPGVPVAAPLPDPLPGGAPLDGAATATPALQDALAAEHAAVWAVAVLGARTSRSAQPVLAEALAAAYVVHRDRRDLLESLLDGLGEEPVAAAATYELPLPAGAPVPAVRRAAAGIEAACAGWYAALVAASVGSTRGLAVTCLSDAAIRGLAFRGSPEIFPGLGEFADR